MPEEENRYGEIEISSTAVASVASQAVDQCYGVVGMASKGFVDGIAQLLTRDPHRGIDVQMHDDGIQVDVYVIVEYGIRIRAVAESIQNTVQFHVVQATGRPVKAVNVFVQGLLHTPDQ
ncbi:MAG: Asp23/Gls24 family envelope stress response protein [Ardenticatenaceae bacterium]|nr:Asp23/Gls24 family envelope stress response protein [Ardenticatenaceae bacterium]